MKNNQLKEWIAKYLEYRRGLGYKADYDAKILRAFARYAVGRHFRGPLQRSWAEGFAALPTATDPVYRAVRLRVVRDFARYWASFDPRTQVPFQGGPYGAYRRKEPYIYSDADVRALMKAARSGTTDQGIPGDTYATLLGLMACTGLRTGEAAQLQREDVDWQQQLLRIRHSKGRPLRLVPIHDTTAKALALFAKKRDTAFPHAESPRFFLTKYGRPLSAKAIGGSFRRIRRRAGVAAPPGRRQPRPYDFRHTFACNCLLAWLRQGRDMSRSMHILSNYLGHEKIEATYWYLSAVPAIFQLVGKRFEQHAQKLGRA